MKLLVVTPTLGRSGHLEEVVAAVASVATRVPLQHVVVAPGENASKLEHDHPGMLVVAENKPSGIYGAIHTASQAVPGWRWLTWINDDDRLESGFGTAYSTAAALPAGMHVVYGDVRYLDDAGRNLGRLPITRPAWVPALLARARAPFTQQGALISRELWDQLGGFDLQWRLAADFDFWCRAAISGATFHRVADTVASFRLHGRQLSADQKSVSEEVSRICVRHRPTLERRSQPGAWLFFRLASTMRILERRYRAGVWTSRALYARYSVKP